MDCIQYHTSHSGSDQRAPTQASDPPLSHEYSDPLSEPYRYTAGYWLVNELATTYRWVGGPWLLALLRRLPSIRQDPRKLRIYADGLLWGWVIGAIFVLLGELLFQAVLEEFTSIGCKLGLRM